MRVVRQKKRINIHPAVIWVSIIILALINVSILPASSSYGSEPGNGIEQGIADDVRIGDIVTLGHYEQDNNLDNGSEPIEWEVLTVQDEKALLLSCYALDSQPFNQEKVPDDSLSEYILSGTYWDRSSLRAWLNSTFLSNAFDENESFSIITTQVKTGELVVSETWDKLFLLSVNELETYYNIEVNHDNLFQEPMPQDVLICRVTDYARERAVETFSEILSDQTYEQTRDAFEKQDNEYGKNSCSWWLRDRGDYGNMAASVNVVGDVRYRAEVNNPYGVRPAMWVHISSLKAMDHQDPDVSDGLSESGL